MTKILTLIIIITIALVCVIIYFKKKVNKNLSIVKNTKELEEQVKKEITSEVKPRMDLLYERESTKIESKSKDIFIESEKGIYKKEDQDVYINYGDIDVYECIQEDIYEP